MFEKEAMITVENLSMSHADRVIQQKLDFQVQANRIFVIMGNSGSGKSTLLRTMTGLHQPDSGEVYFRTHKAELVPFWHSSTAQQYEIQNHFGVMFQNGALFSSMTLLENVSLRLTQSTQYSAKRIRKIAQLKLALVGLKGYEDYFPAEISGGMQKRVSIARAMVMDPPILFFDEPSAGLDPLSSKLLDDLLLQLRESLGITMVVVTHELDSIFTIADDAIYLDHDQKTIIARGSPEAMLEYKGIKPLQAFLTRGKSND